MRNRQTMIALVLLAAVIALVAGGARAQGTPVGTTFTYQGSLSDGAAPANGPYDMQFRIYGAASDGAPLAAAITRDDVAVAAGIFVVALDFGPIFDGSPRYLEVSVRPGASADAFTTLSPRQELTAAPVAIYSGASAASDTTRGLQGRPVSPAAPTAGQVLAWNGTQWAPAAGASYSAGVGLTLSGGRFDLRFAGNGSSTAAARSDHNHFGQLWVGDVPYTALWIDNRSTNAGAAGLVALSVNSNGLQAESVSSSGVDGRSRTGVGVRGSSSNLGVLGSSANVGVKGESSGAGGATGVWGVNTGGGWAGFFSGNVHVNGTLSKLSGSFKIDHPLDPANQYLSHSFVESPDMLNIYNGTVVLDADGKATVTLPGYFEALNIDYRYQLTPIGGAAPNLYIAAEVRENRFAIAGGTPGLKVSWQVTGVRNDPYARDHRIVAEEPKPADERGTYLYPAGAGAPASSGLDAQMAAPASAPGISAADTTSAASDAATPPTPGPQQ